MDEVVGRDGTWTFDLEAVRIVPGHDRGVHKLRKALGELLVPLRAIAGISFEPGKKGGKLRLRLRAGTDPLTQATGGRFSDSADPYQLAVDSNQVAAGQLFAEAVRTTLLVHQTPSTPSDTYLMPAPPVPASAAAGDGTASFDGERIRLEWNWLAEESKSAGGAVELAIGDVSAVEWQPQTGIGHGYLRFRLKGVAAGAAPQHDRHCLAWGIQKEGGTTALLAAAVISRLPHPYANPALPPAAPAPAQDPDAMLRRLRELGELHKEGILTDEEFSVAKQTLLRS
ncbi:MAG: DUF4429 domain-containing protein [Kibdelosporangium sp.]